MPHPSKQKGNVYEREVVDYCKRSGVDAKRAWGSNGEALGEHVEVDVIIGEGDNAIRAQCKRRKQLPKYLIPSDAVDCTIARADWGDSVVICSLGMFLDLLTQGDKSNSVSE